MTSFSVISDLKKYTNPTKAHNSAWFFKTQPGGYGEGDLFLGLTNPQVHEIARLHKTLPLTEIERLIQNKYHEVRFTGLILLSQNMKKIESTMKKNDTKELREVMTELVNVYVRNIQHINNWDLVDCSAHKVLGPFIWYFPKEQKRLDTLAASQNIWKRRIAILTTFYFIGRGEFDLSLRIAQTLVYDQHDLIHKAVGWMLREIGKRSITVETAFLDEFASSMPRTMLRYAIEKFPEPERKRYLEKGKKVVK
jgi:3-methyladenine DNA glycosylase AlkD